MNTHNDNLYSTVAALLESREIDQKALASQLDAAGFTLYYAQGALIAAKEQLEAAQQTLGKKAAVKKQSTDYSNVSGKQLSSANLADQYVKQSVTNMAVCASNVQVATNAILRLAGTIGSIYAIVNAADFETEIFNLTKTVRNFINETASDAELASQMAMDSSVLASEVPAQTVLDKSKSTNSLINTFLQLSSADFDAVSQIYTTANATIATVSAKEKVAEGSIEDSRAAYLSSISAYQITNKALNLNLSATRVYGLESTSFEVKFNLMRSAFDQKKAPATGSDIYPVKAYYIIVVKDKKKTTFSADEAKKIINTGVHHKKIDDTEIQYIQYVLVNGHQTEKEKAQQNGEKHDVAQSIAINNALGAGVFLFDSDGDGIVPGTRYVVFVTAVYEDDYQIKLSNFDDYLSAASAPFSLSYLLKPVSASIQIVPVAGSHSGTQTAVPDDCRPETDSSPRYLLIFDTLSKNPAEVEYRCMFLPFDDNSLQGLLTDSSIAEHDIITASMPTNKQHYPLPFFFNLELAEQVPYGNYTTAKQHDIAGSVHTGWFYAPIGPDTTDNFGNPLIKGKRYTPVILSVAAVLVRYQVAYTNALSDFNNTAPFSY